MKKKNHSLHTILRCREQWWPSSLQHSLRATTWMKQQKRAHNSKQKRKKTHEEMKLKLFLSTVSPVMSACALQPFHITLRKTSWRNGSLWIIYNISSCPSWIGFTYSSFCICVQRKSLLYRFQIQTMNVLNEGRKPKLE